MNVKLQEADWIKILNILAGQPFRDVAQVITLIQNQLNEQIQTQQSQGQVAQFPARNQND